MGIKPAWHQEVISCLSVFKLDILLDDASIYDLIFIGQGKLVVNLVSLCNDYQPIELIDLQKRYEHQNIYLIHLWEDVWRNRREQVLGRLKSIVGLNNKIHGRKTKIVSISQLEADAFFNAHHILASAKCKYRFALTFEGAIVAVAGFSNLRLMTKISPEYRSAELIRFASVTGHTVTGGFTKLLKYFASIYHPDDVMSYADRDWSLGRAYERSGFILVAETPPSAILLNPETLQRHFPHRLPMVKLDSLGEAEIDDIHKQYIQVFNTGNLKYLFSL